MKENKKIRIISQYYWPEKIGSAPYITEISEWLQSEGYSVSVFTNRPYYPELNVFNEYKLGELDQQEKDKVQISRVNPYIPKRNNFLYRGLSDLFFFLKALFSYSNWRRYDYIITLCPSIFSVALGNIFRNKKTKNIAIVHDIQSGLAKGLKLGGTMSFLAKVVEFIERKVLNSANEVVVLTQEMNDSLLKIGVKRDKIHIIPIWVDIDYFSPADDQIRENLLMYSGNMGRKQGLDQLLDLAKSLQENGQNDLKILIRGDGNVKESLISKAQSMKLKNIQFDDLVPIEKLREELLKPELHLIPQDPSASAYAMPSKIYKILSLGKIIVATASSGSTLSRLADETKAFICVAPNKPNELKDAILELIYNPDKKAILSKNARNYVIKHHAKDVIMKHYKDLLKS